MDFCEDDIRAISESIWGAVLGLPALPASGPDTSADEPAHVVGGVDISGAWSGTVLVHCPAALAQRAAGIVFDVAAETTTATQIADAVCELTNMIGGNVKSLLPEPCVLAFPRILVGAERAAVLEVSVAAQVAFECESQVFLVSIRESDASETTAHP